MCTWSNNVQFTIRNDRPVHCILKWMRKIYCALTISTRLEIKAIKILSVLVRKVERKITKTKTTKLYNMHQIKCFTPTWIYCSTQQLFRNIRISGACMRGMFFLSIFCSDLSSQKLREQNHRLMYTLHSAHSVCYKQTCVCCVLIFFFISFSFDFFFTSLNLYLVNLYFCLLFKTNQLAIAWTIVSETVTNDTVFINF